uniref:Uncharacterized mitochondrial protein AtMg00810-like n=1 Tax=Nicotiana tabacum TaxID=4097 RepID=A0A1S4D6Q3_TOBAC|nr:PREDICTED: uncharacterized mitochondrial protein AtMg00810-like [Nicotiana tabacum]
METRWSADAADVPRSLQNLSLSQGWNTRPDITYNVQHLSQYIQSPTDSHLKATVHVLRYLKGNLSLGIFLSNSTNYRLRAFCDSDWASFPETRKSFRGDIVLRGASPITWKSKKQSTISLSSVEAEYRAVRKVVGELIWLARLLEELTYPFLCPYLSFMTAKQHFTLQRIQSFMSGPSI